MWVYFVVMAIATVAAYALAPGATDVSPSTVEDSDIPTADEGGAIPVVFGTVVVKSSNIVWYGDLGYKAVKSSGGK